MIETPQRIKAKAIGTPNANDPNSDPRNTPTNWFSSLCRMKSFKCHDSYCLNTSSVEEIMVRFESVFEVNVWNILIITIAAIDKLVTIPIPYR